VTCGNGNLTVRAYPRKALPSGRNLAMGRPLAFLPRLAFCGQSGSLIRLWPAQWPLGLGVADFVVISPKRNHIDGGSRLTMNRDRRSGGSTLKRSIRFLLALHSPSTKGTNGPSEIAAIMIAATFSIGLSLRNSAIFHSCLI
jgi:hypothetical protein